MLPKIDRTAWSYRVIETVVPGGRNAVVDQLNATECLSDVVGTATSLVDRRCWFDGQMWQIISDDQSTESGGNRTVRLARQGGDTATVTWCVEANQTITNATTRERVDGDAIFTRKPLSIKFGIDPTGVTMHVGHAVNFWVMKEWQKMGHKVHLVIGNATAKIGDPTGKDQMRPQLSDLQIQENAEKMLSCIRSMLLTDPSVLAVHDNATWYQGMDSLTFIDRLLRQVTLNQLTQRNSFQNRIGNRVPIYLHEMVYQLLQGYDSVILDADVALCGNDQLTNELMGRQLQVFHQQQPQTVVTTRLTPGIHGGEKQGKSLDNYIGLDHHPHEQYRRIMSIPDALIATYFETYTELSQDVIETYFKQFRCGHPSEPHFSCPDAHPRMLKKALCKGILQRLHPIDQCIRSAENYEISATKKGSYPDDAPVYLVDDIRVDWIAFAHDTLGLTKSAFRRLVEGNAVAVNGEKLTMDQIKQCNQVGGYLLTQHHTGHCCLKYGKSKWAVLRCKPGSTKGAITAR